MRNILLKPYLQYIQQVEKRLIFLEDTFRFSLKFPYFSPDEAMAFNKQFYKTAMVTDIVAHITFDNIIETGCWLGFSCGYMAYHFKLPIFSCEINPLFFDVAQKRLSNLTGIELANQNSVDFISSLVSKKTNLTHSLFYLDAHWYDYLPLADELRIITTHWKDYVIIIDDFQVPNDKGYLYDDYGPKKKLTIEILLPFIKKFDLKIFYPSTPSDKETGYKQGCIVVTNSKNAESLRPIGLLRESTLF
jgi:hypothetical protein